MLEAESMHFSDSKDKRPKLAVMPYYGVIEEIWEVDYVKVRFPIFKCKNYYRCTHKDDQGCEAIKHVQKIQDDPDLFRTTYFSHHTCTNPLNPLIFLDSHDLVNSTSAFGLSFENNNHNNNHLITTFEPENNNNVSSFFVSSGSLFPSFSSVKKEDHCDNNIKQEKNKEAVLPAFGSGDYDQVDVFNSAAFYDPLGGLEDLLFEII
ncbi:hypothetical protein K1719_020803 [Acacia pycnantha]|nr:hypothetical protein K1719_020803 [Acacia pycnantha]